MAIGRRIQVQLGILTLAVAMVCSLAASAAAQHAIAKQQPYTPPKYCQPCLFYGGDFDSNNSDANGVFDEFAPSQDGEAYVPFAVPKGQKWQVTGLFVNLIALSRVTPANVRWEMRTGVSTGSGGRLLASGRARAILGGEFDCGQSWVFCEGVVMKKIKVPLRSGRYWLSVVPDCAGSGGCGNTQFYVADVEDNPPPNHFGPIEPWDDSFFSSKSKGAYFQPTWGSSGACGGLGCDRLSAGVLGTK